jgi:hypothetical protein
VQIWQGQSHFSQKWPLGNVSKSGESEQNRLANVGKSGESEETRLGNVGESGESQHISKKHHFGEYSNYPNSLKLPSWPNFEMTVILYFVPWTIEGISPYYHIS